MTQKTQPPKVTRRQTPMAALIFTIVCVLLFPAMLVGYVLWAVRAFAGRAAGTSGTAQGPLSARWFQHQIGIRSDEAAQRLLMVLPGISPLAVWLLFGPMLLAHRLSGYIPLTFHYPFRGRMTMLNQASARQTLYDSVVERYLAQVTQFVVLGAGFDTRAYRLPRESRVRAFEVDTPQTMSVKRDALQRVGINPAEVALVSADFEKEDWLGRLVEAGFELDKPALFLWEGVTPYLDHSAVEATLRRIAGTAKGSLLAFDYFTNAVLESKSLVLRILRAVLRAAGEPLKFGVDSTPPVRERLSELLQACGLSLVEQQTLGQESDGKRILGGFAIANVP